MSVTTTIEWAANRDGTPGATWNPVRGCSKISDGCRNCYAERMAGRFCKPGEPFYDYATSSPGRWTWKVDLMPHMLSVPLKRRKPTTYFVNSMSDLFHETLPSGDVERVFEMMERCPQHTFIILTKRASWMREWFRLHPRWGNPPLPHVILGVSAEDQPNADIRLPILLDTPAACRVVSLEPLLGPIRIEPWIPTLEIERETRTTSDRYLDWVILGGESGPGARPMNPEWARTVRDQCAMAEVPFFFKQWGGVRKAEAGRLLDGREWNQRPKILEAS